MMALYSFVLLWTIGSVPSAAFKVKRMATLRDRRQAPWMPNVRHWMTNKAVLPQNAAQKHIDPHVTTPPFYEPDLTELILLAGHTDTDISLTKKAMNRIGWTPGIMIEDAALKANCMLDHAWTFKKGTHCIAAFAAANDAQDLQESEMGYDGINSNTTQLCGFHVNAGVVAELLSFQTSPNWAAFVDYFSNPECETVTSVGHSLGGAVASVFAACTNVKQEGFGQRTDFGLVTFGTYPVSLEPLYSGTPGTPFRGTRYHISGLDGGMKARDSLPQRTKGFRVDILNFYAKLLATTNNTFLSQNLSRTAEFISTLPDKEVEKAWRKASFAELLLPMHVNLQYIWAGFLEGSGILETRWLLRELMHNLTIRGDVTFYHDPVSPLFAEFGYKHPLVDYQPIVNKLLGNRHLSRIAASKAIELPHVDYFVNTMGAIIEPKIPNHANCCYFQGNDCLQNYEHGHGRYFKECSAILYR